MTKEEAKEVLNLLLAAFPATNNHIGEDTVLVYHAYLMLLPLEIGQFAVCKIISNNKFFPAIAEIKEAARSFAPLADKLPTPEEAWEEVAKKLDIYHFPEWSSPVIERAVRAVGYSNICRSENLGVERAHFLRFYEAYKKLAENELENQYILRITGSVRGCLKGI